MGTLLRRLHTCCMIPHEAQTYNKQENIFQLKINPPTDHYDCKHFIVMLHTFLYIETSKKTIKTKTQQAINVF